MAANLDGVSSVIDHLDACISASEGEGYVVEGAEWFWAARVELDSLRERFRDGWPMLDVKAAQAASARIAAGQFVALEDLAGALDAKGEREK